MFNRDFLSHDAYCCLFEFFPTVPRFDHVNLLYHHLGHTNLTSQMILINQQISVPRIIDNYFIKY